MTDRIPGLAECRALLRFLPVFERPGFHFGGFESIPGQFGAVSFAPEAWAFMDALSEHGWVEPFDWPSWQNEAERYVREPDRVLAADLGTLQKLLTLHVRKERFCEGHLLGMFENGHLTAILRRLEAIAVDLKRPGESGSPRKSGKRKRARAKARS